MGKLFRRALFPTALLGAAAAFGATPGAPVSAPWADYVEPNFPFFCSIVDARQAGGLSPADNLTPRGIVLNLGGSRWACFDTELLRVSAAWTGGALTPTSMAQASYQTWYQKSAIGESDSPRPRGPVWMANGLYPGWQIGTEPELSDPRSPAPSPKELGRGPLPGGLGRFEAIQLTAGGALLKYDVGGTEISERMRAFESAGHPALIRSFRIGPSKNPLLLVLSRRSSGRESGAISAAIVNASEGLGAELSATAQAWIVRVPARDKAGDLAVAVSAGDLPIAAAPEAAPDEGGPFRAHWPEVVTTSALLSNKQEAYVVDDIGLPLDNPWRRNVRPADIQFLPDGTAVLVTIDGDVWRLRGLNGNLDHVQWKRFASGLNEPLSLAVRDGEIYVFDRGGIWRLRDTTGSGEADVYELFSNAFAQTADSRDYASSIKVAPDGAFIVAKGGVQQELLGKHNGRVIRVSPDGRDIRVLGWGFRQAFLGVDPRTGMVTASDQEGNYVPATPLDVVDGGKFYGFLCAFEPREKYPAPIADPLTWIPHTVLPSALSQVWLSDPRLGPLDGSMVLVSYNFPEIFKVILNRREPRLQAAVVSITQDFHFAPLSGSVNPADGQLYLAGLKIFSSGAERVAGLARVRYTGSESALPREVIPMDRGVLLRFDAPLDPAAARNRANYVVETWNYKRTHGYGSLQYRSDGTVGQDQMPVAEAYLSRDGKGVFLIVPGMRTDVMQLHVGWSLRSSDGMAIKNHAYLTPYVLSRFVPEAEGFGGQAIDLGAQAAPSEAPSELTTGVRLAQAFGCVACHSTDGSTRVGPTWKGLYGQKVIFADGSSALADDAFIRDHLVPHPHRVVRGFAAEMPSYAGLLSEAQRDALIQYIRSLR